MDTHLMERLETAIVEDKDASRVPARKPGKKTKVLGDAPGDYVKVRV